ncbi:unnamed protein product [Amoebophrya sp. A120]|nr:unnamed protein product [Amoebophrya sp. A120]|eukprot:GSA120T00006543001.1
MSTSILSTGPDCAQQHQPRGLILGAGCRFNGLVPSTLKTSRRSSTDGQRGGSTGRVYLSGGLCRQRRGTRGGACCLAAEGKGRDVDGSRLAGTKSAGREGEGETWCVEQEIDASSRIDADGSTPGCRMYDTIIESGLFASVDILHTTQRGEPECIAELLKTALLAAPAAARRPGVSGAEPHDFMDNEGPSCTSRSSIAASSSASSTFSSNTGKEETLHDDAGPLVDTGPYHVIFASCKGVPHLLDALDLLAADIATGDLVWPKHHRMSLFLGRNPYLGDAECARVAEISQCVHRHEALVSRVCLASHFDAPLTDPDAVREKLNTTVEEGLAGAASREYYSSQSVRPTGQTKGIEQQFLFYLTSPENLLSGEAAQDVRVAAAIQPDSRYSLFNGASLRMRNKTLAMASCGAADADPGSVDRIASVDLVTTPARDHGWLLGWTRDTLLFNPKAKTDAYAVARLHHPDEIKGGKISFIPAPVQRCVSSSRGIEPALAPAPYIVPVCRWLLSGSSSSGAASRCTPAARALGPIRRDAAHVFLHQVRSDLDTISSRRSSLFLKAENKLQRKVWGYTAQRVFAQLAGVLGVASAEALEEVVRTYDTHDVSLGFQLQILGVEHQTCGSPVLGDPDDSVAGHFALQDAVKDFLDPRFAAAEDDESTIGGFTSTSTSRARMLVFHGTSQAAARRILAEGKFRTNAFDEVGQCEELKQETCGQLSLHTAKAYGDAVYTAFHPETALRYAKGRGTLEDEDCGALLVCELQHGSMPKSKSESQEDENYCEDHDGAKHGDCGDHNGSFLSSPTTTQEADFQISEEAMVKREEITGKKIIVTDDARESRWALARGLPSIVRPWEQVLQQSKNPTHDDSSSGAGQADDASSLLGKNFGSFLVLPAQQVKNKKARFADSGGAETGRLEVSLRPLCAIHLARANSTSTRRGVLRQFRQFLAEQQSCKDPDLQAHALNVSTSLLNLTDDFWPETKSARPGVDDRRGGGLVWTQQDFDAVLQFAVHDCEASDHLERLRKLLLEERISRGGITGETTTAAVTSERADEIAATTIALPHARILMRQENGREATKRRIAEVRNSVPRLLAVLKQEYLDRDLHGIEDEERRFFCEAASHYEAASLRSLIDHASRQPVEKRLAFSRAMRHLWRLFQRAVGSGLLLGSENSSGTPLLLGPTVQRGTTSTREGDDKCVENEALDVSVGSAASDESTRSSCGSVSTAEETKEVHFRPRIKEKHTDVQKAEEIGRHLTLFDLLLRLEDELNCEYLTTKRIDFLQLVAQMNRSATERRKSSWTWDFFSFTHFLSDNYSFLS